MKSLRLPTKDSSSKGELIYEPKTPKAIKARGIIDLVMLSATTESSGLELKTKDA